MTAWVLGKDADVKVEEQADKGKGKGKGTLAHLWTLTSVLR
jgi:hypothetical protein